MRGSDHKSEQLYNFVCRLYSICTKRTLPENAPLVDLPPTQANNPNLTASYLLKEDGLEKLENSNSNVLANSGNKSNLVDNSKVEEKAQAKLVILKFLRVLNKQKLISKEQQT